MSTDEIQQRFTELLMRRAEEMFRVGADPRELTDFLVDTAGITATTAEALCWAQTVAVTAAELDSLSDLFGFHRDLLACLLRPTSPEVYLHVLNQTAEESLDVYGCGNCELLGDTILSLSAATAPAMLAEACFDVIEHLSRGEERDTEQEALQPADPLDEELLRAVSALDLTARKRVLAFAYSELASSLVDDPADRRVEEFAAYSRLRSDHLPVLTRRVFDALAASDSGSLSAQELVDQLRLNDARPLGQIKRSLDGALRRANWRSSTEVLEINRGPAGTRFRLPAPVLKVWRALLDSDRSPVAR